MRRAASAGTRTKHRGSAMPVVLAMAVGVGALAAGFSAQNLREHQRERWERNRQRAYLTAWSNLENVVSIVNASPYDASSRNQAIQQAVARGGRFVDRDGHELDVRAEEVAGAPGFFRLTSDASVEDADARVSALVRERRSFADFNWFVDRHDLGFAGGRTLAEAPRGAIHSNRGLKFYFPERWFRDAVTAVDGFSYEAGATSDTTHLRGMFSASAAPVTGLMEVEPASFAGRADCILSLAAADDFARMRLRGTEVEVEHWKEGRWETQMVPEQVAVNRVESRQVEQYRQVTRDATIEVPVYETRGEWQTVQVPESVLVQAAWTESVTETVNVPVQVWVPDSGGSGGDGALGGGGASGHWETHYEPQQVTRTVEHPAVYDTRYHEETRYVDVQVQIGVRTEHTTITENVPYSPAQYETVQTEVFDHYESQLVPHQVWIPPYLVDTRTVGSTGTIYVAGRVELVATSGDGSVTEAHWLDGSLTIAAGGDIVVQDSIRYAKRDANGVLQTAYVNGTAEDQPYQPNPQYHGASVLGLVAGNDVILDSALPDRTEINAAMLARNGEVRVAGVDVTDDGTIREADGGFVKSSMRRLGAVISSRRPCTAFVDGGSNVTRGFRAGSSVYDLRMRTTPPRGFPTLSRPHVLAAVVSGREVN